MTPTDPGPDPATVARKRARVFTKKEKRTTQNNRIALHEEGLPNWPGCKHEVRALS